MLQRTELMYEELHIHHYYLRLRVLIDNLSHSIDNSVNKKIIQLCNQ